MENVAYIDWQNLHLWTTEEWWLVDLYKLRKYLLDKFEVTTAYYFLWFLNENENDLYKRLQKAGFIVVFREHSNYLLWKKKWNVDCDIVFEILTWIIDKKETGEIILVSWDGDYIKLVKYLIGKNLLKKVIFPNKKRSSLYNSIDSSYVMNLWEGRTREKLEYKK